MKTFDFDLEREINIADTIYSLKDFDFYNKIRWLVIKVHVQANHF